MGRSTNFCVNPTPTYSSCVVSTFEVLSYIDHSRLRFFSRPQHGWPARDAFSSSAHLAPSTKSRFSKLHQVVIDPSAMKSAVHQSFLFRLTSLAPHSAFMHDAGCPDGSWTI